MNISLNFTDCGCPETVRTATGKSFVRSSTRGYYNSSRPIISALSAVR